MTLSWPDKGDHDVKATKEGAIRSNRVRVCVTDGADGACGTRVPAPIGAPAPAAAPDRAAPVATLLGFTDKQVFRTGPRELQGSFARRLRHQDGQAAPRQARRRPVLVLLPTMETFRRTGCGHREVLRDRRPRRLVLPAPARLGKGRYVLDAVAIDGAGNRTPLARGTTRVVFTVR